MKIKMVHIYWMFICATAFHRGFAQTGITVKATVDRNAILIGEPIELHLEADMPAANKAAWFAIDSIAHFDVIQKADLDSVVSAGTRSLRQNLRITSFDSGMQVIPPFQVMINNQTYYTDSIPVMVSFSNFDRSRDYHDIKDIIEVENPAVRYIVWILACFTIICTAALIWLLSRKEAVNASADEPVAVAKETAYQEAIRSLEELYKQQLTAKGQSKLYYTRLNDILRIFLWHKMGIDSLEKTNEELILLLQRVPLNRDQFSQLAQVLRMSDFVKFAKYLPKDSDNEQNFKIIQSSVDVLNTIET